MALANTAGAFLMLIFLNMYVYLATTRHTPFAHIKAMITGWEDEEPEGDPARSGRSLQGGDDPARSGMP